MFKTESALWSPTGRRPIAGWRDFRSAGKAALTLLITGLVSGCVGFPTLFNQLDRLVVWRMDDMFDLTSQQSEAVEPVVVGLQEWLRHDGFPLVIERLEQADRDWRRRQTMQTVLGFEASGLVLLDRFLEESCSRVTPLISKLTPANAEQYREYSDEKMADWFESSESFDNKLKKRTERFEDWLGDLKQSQIDIIKRHTQLADNEYKMKVDNSRQRRERALELALANDVDTLKSLCLSPSRMQSPDYRHWRQQERDSILAAIDELLPTLGGKQKRHVSERLDDWISTLEEVVRG